MKTNFKDYTVCVGNDPSNYGPDCTRDQSLKIADSIQNLIESQFPEINVRRTKETGSPTPTVGPDSAVIDEINEWIQHNWTAAL